MKGRVMEKAAAVFCALCLAVGVMSGAVFAKDKDGTEASPSAPEETFVVVDMDLSGGGESPWSSGEAEEDAVPTPALTPEVTDNRDRIPLYVNDAECGDCPIIGGVPYMGAVDFCRALGMSVYSEISGDVFTLGGDIDMNAAAGEIYFVCNGRYILMEDGVRLRDGQALLPVEALAKCAGVSAAWDRVQWTVHVRHNGVAPLQNGDTYYEETDVYWLSRVIYAEAGNQPLRGQIAVGNVVLNRVADEAFSDQNNVYDVIFAKNQFDVVINGMIYMEPSESAKIAAKLALEGGDVVGDATYFATFDFGEGYECVMWIGDHCFMTEA